MSDTNNITIPQVMRDTIREKILAAMKNMQFLRYNIPQELANMIRPLSSLDAKRLQNLHLAFRHDEWSEAASKELDELYDRADRLAFQLENLLNLNGYVIREKDGVKSVVSSKSPLGNRILFTWQLPEYEEYDGGLLSQQNEEEFLADVMAGLYDDKYDKQYLSHMYQKRELREGVIPDGDGHLHCFVDKQVHLDEDVDEDNMNSSELHIHAI